MSGIPMTLPPEKRCVQIDLEEEAARLEFEIGLDRVEAEAEARKNCGCSRRFSRPPKPK